MYPTKQRAEQRMAFISKEIEVLLKEERSLQRNLMLLEAEKIMLIQLVNVYNLEEEHGREQD